MRFKGEMKKLETVASIASEIGYGNCIQYLRNKWADHLVKGGMGKEAAAIACGMTKAEVKTYVKLGSSWLMGEG